ncbi:MAG: hypothetical protein WKF37_17820 [Bryobacteraceae bacterium]
MENREIATVLAETADLMEIAGEDSFRIRSYRNAATAVDAYPERLEDISASAAQADGGPGHWQRTAGVITEVLTRGSFDKRDKLLAKYPPTALELLEIQGLGPKSIALLIEHFRISTVDDLDRICREQKLRTRHGWSKTGRESSALDRTVQVKFRAIYCRLQPAWPMS